MFNLFIWLNIVAIASTATTFNIGELLHRKYLPWSYGTCDKKSSLSDFDHTRFFTGHWYEQSSYGNYVFQADGVCTSFETEINGDNVNYLFYQYEPLLKKYAYLRGRADLSKIDESGNLYLKFDFFAGLASIEIPYSVIATDYENYAVFYSCQEVYGFKSEMAWVATRVRGDHNNDEEIKKALVSANFKYEDFIYQREFNCPTNEPHL